MGMGPAAVPRPATTVTFSGIISTAAGLRLCTESSDWLRVMWLGALAPLELEGAALPRGPHGPARLSLQGDVAVSNHRLSFGGVVLIAR